MAEINIKIEPLISKQPIEIGMTVPGPKGIQGPQGADADPTILIDDVTPSSDKTYSSNKVVSELDDKVDKVTGKQLSTEDYTTTEKNKLAGVELGAEVNNPIANNLTTTVAGSALDATQGKVINDSLVAHKAKIATQANLGHVKVAPNLVDATLQNGWLGTIKYTKDTLGYVTLHFNAYGGVVVVDTIIATLPVGYRPNAMITLPINAENTSVDQSAWYVVIRNDGTIKVGLRSGIQAGYGAQGRVIYIAMA